MPSVYRSTAARDQVRNWCTEQIDAWQVPHIRSELMTSAGVTGVVAAGPAPQPEQPSIVLVPGTNMSAAVSLEAARALSERRHTVVLDVPGQPGLSAGLRPRRGRMAWYGRWLAETLEQAVPGPAVVIGHSLGGAIALAASSPRIVGRVLVSPAGLARLKVPPPVLADTLPWLVRPSVPRAAQLLRRMLAPGRRVPADLCAWMALVGRCCRSSLAPPPLPSELLVRQNSAPRLVMAGRHDIFLPPGSLGPAARRRLGVGLHVVDGAGHLLLDEQPDRVADLVEEFCDNSLVDHRPG